MISRIRQTAAWGVLVTASGLLLTGCSSQPPLAPVQGVVTYEGKPVSLGRLMFAPISETDPAHPGKPAYSKVATDGTYSLKTYKADDGALVGPHLVEFEPGGEPAGEYRDGKEYAPTAETIQEWRQLRGLVPQSKNVIVVAGKTNIIDIELVKP
ncbi:hypothetical protein M4951_03450 [Blastopirellula sp. J2-11]|uniref:hypothetical protein n=1 Tax=Blastopirellula sp. J2-11 TaxID=2943192 RepID=UPI0021C95121|nr:hypothetical protein [Blastopirellula sp. J2-11]UUO07371.1 hypothetical protein M4951_03450 [Blastopirellula sp. J2-11]